MVDSKNQRLAVVIPVYNEQDCIDSVIRTWHSQILDTIDSKNVKVSIFAVNDGSKDSSGEILDKLSKCLPELIVVHQSNAGHGGAVLNGYKHAIEDKADWVFQVDSDDQFEASDFGRFWRSRFEYDFVLGYRANRSDPTARLIITRILRLVVSVLFLVNIKDANNPFRLMKVSTLKPLLAMIPESTFAPNIFISVLFFFGKSKTAELPVLHKIRKTGEISILRFTLLKVCALSALQLARLSLRLLGVRSKGMIIRVAN